MTCNRAFEVDLTSLLCDANAPELDSFRSHYPTCVTCAAEVRALTDVHRLLEAHGARRVTHPVEEELVAFQRDQHRLTAHARDRISAHLRECRTCADEVRTLASSALGPSLLASAGAVAPKTSLRTRMLEALDWMRRCALHPAFAYALVIALLIPTVRETLRTSAPVHEATPPALDRPVDSAGAVLEMDRPPALTEPSSQESSSDTSAASRFASARREPVSPPAVNPRRYEPPPIPDAPQGGAGWKIERRETVRGGAYDGPIADTASGTRADVPAESADGAPVATAGDAERNAAKVWTHASLGPETLSIALGDVAAGLILAVPALQFGSEADVLVTDARGRILVREPAAMVADAQIAIRVPAAVLRRTGYRVDVKPITGGSSRDRVESYSFTIR